MRILLLTGGGHIDFSEALITMINAQRARGNQILASVDGWKTIGKKNATLADITDHPTEFIQYIGGSFLGSSRTNPNLDVVLENCRRHDVDVIIPHGGGDTLKVANEAHKEKGIKIVGWPKTMDNDTNGSYATIGYTTAAYVAALQTFEAFRTAFTNSKIVLVPMFGRTYDWVIGAAANYGHADYVIPAESPNLSLDQVSQQIKDIYQENGRKYWKPFAVVGVSEGAVTVSDGVRSLEGLVPYIERIRHGHPVRYDEFGHPKLTPEVLGLALEEALAEKMNLSSDRFALKSVTYHLRDPNLIPLDRLFSKMTSEECARLIDKGDFGRVATIQDPDFSGFLPTDSSLHVDAHGKTLYVGSVPLEEAVRERPVKGTGYFDYDRLAPTESFSNYLFPLLGPKPENPRDKIVPFKVAIPVKNHIQ